MMMSPGQLGRVSGQGVRGVVSQLPAPAQVQSLDVGAVPGKDQQGVVTNILRRDRGGLLARSVMKIPRKKIYIIQINSRLRTVDINLSI